MSMYLNIIVNKNEGIVIQNLVQKKQQFGFVEINDDIVKGMDKDRIIKTLNYREICVYDKNKTNCFNY